MFTALSLCGGGVPSATPGGVWRYLWCECPVSGLVQSSLKDKGQETGSHLSKTDHNSSTGQPQRNHTLERKVPKSPVLVSVSGAYVQTSSSVSWKMKKVQLQSTLQIHEVPCGRGLVGLRFETLNILQSMEMFLSLQSPSTFSFSLMKTWDLL